MLWHSSALGWRLAAVAKESAHLGYRASSDTALHLNKRRAAIASVYKEATDWEPPEALTGMPGTP